MRLRRIFLIVLIGGLFLSMGNLAAPYYACAGKAEGDHCNYGYGCFTGGTCQIEQSCTDNPSTEINECLVCNTRD